MGKIINFKEEVEKRKLWDYHSYKVNQYYDYLDFIYENLPRENVKTHKRIFHVNELPHKKEDLTDAYLEYRTHIYFDNNWKQPQNKDIEESILEFLGLAHFQDKYILIEKRSIKILKNEKLQMLVKLKNEFLCGGVLKAKKIVRKKNYNKICKLLKLEKSFLNNFKEKISQII